MQVLAMACWRRRTSTAHLSRVAPVDSGLKRRQLLFQGGKVEGCLPALLLLLVHGRRVAEGVGSAAHGEQRAAALEAQAARTRTAAIVASRDLCTLCQRSGQQPRAKPRAVRACAFGQARVRCLETRRLLESTTQELRKTQQ